MSTIRYRLMQAKELRVLRATKDIGDRLRTKMLADMYGDAQRILKPGLSAQGRIPRKLLADTLYVETGEGAPPGSTTRRLRARR
jgi:hypothetical protein